MSEIDFHLPCISAAEALARTADGALPVDLRKPAARAASGRTLAGAVIRNPYSFGHDDALVHANCPLVVFCVHGHEVSQFGCAMLLLHGRDVAYVRGGYDALVAAGAPLEDLADA